MKKTLSTIAGFSIIGLMIWVMWAFKWIVFSGIIVLAIIKALRKNK